MCVVLENNQSFKSTLSFFYLYDVLEYERNFVMKIESIHFYIIVFTTQLRNLLATVHLKLRNSFCT